MNDWTVLTLTQPWASLIMLGAKKQETRSWKTPYRGKLYIHASKTFPLSSQKLCFTWPFSEYININKEALPLGKIIGCVELYDILTTQNVLENMKYSESEGSQEEFRFGDYTPGRFVWMLRDPVILPKPIETKGSLSLWRHRPQYQNI